ncbi:MAG: cytochrome b/b6 domain-containing protein [Gammaproteobacteria bacterium]
MSRSATLHRHALWVRVCHWVLALSVFALAYSGFYVLMAHPRLYWGEVGNDLTPAWFELPLDGGHRPEIWQQTVTFDALANKPISASRTMEIFNENGWARSLHFLAGWFFVAAGALYFALGVVTKHVSRDLLPRRLERAGAYSLLQRCAYTGVAFVMLPFMVLAGLAMSPRVVAAFPVLLDVFGGYQSARTLHFIGFGMLSAFVVGHVAMTVATGFRRHMRAMILGR